MEGWKPSGALANDKVEELVDPGLVESEGHAELSCPCKSDCDRDCGETRLEYRVDETGCGSDANMAERLDDVSGVDPSLRLPLITGAPLLGTARRSNWEFSCAEESILDGLTLRVVVSIGSGSASPTVRLVRLVVSKACFILKLRMLVSVGSGA